jgi:beta-lactamase class D
MGVSSVGISTGWVKNNQKRCATRQIIPDFFKVLNIKESENFKVS